MVKGKVRSALLILLYVAVCQIVHYAIAGEWSWGAVATGLTMAVLFVFMLPIWTKKEATERLNKIIIELDANENLQAESAANFVTIERTVIGKLALTNKRLIFKSTDLHHKNYRSIMLPHIQLLSMKERRTSRFYKGQVILELGNTEVYKFIVESPNEWVTLLQNRMC